MTGRTDARNVTTTYDYDDPLGRLRRTTHPSAWSRDDVTMDYDNASNLTLMSSQGGGTLRYEYDELNRATEQTWTFGGVEYPTLFHYDGAGCLDSVTYPTGTVLTMTCDAANRVKTIRLGADLVANVTYHPSGQPRAITYGNGVSTTFGIDDRGRVTSVTAPRVLDLHYAYDGADNVTSVEDRLDSTSHRSMTYDAADRLRTVTANGMWGLAQYDYDELGNRTRKRQLGADVLYDYDASSNRLVRSNEAPDHGALSFTWDSEGRLASSSDGVSYRYDGRGRRVAKVEAAQTTLYHYDPSGRVIAETLPDGTKLRDYVYLGNKLIAVDGCVSSNTGPCNDRQWYQTDTLGSAVARTDMSGAVVARLRYMPWGEEWAYQGEAGDRQYNGRVYDPGTGLHDYGARMYWPEIGRFVSADTYQGDPANPASLNRYTYVLNNPYKYTDPTGHEVRVADADKQDYEAAKEYLSKDAGMKRIIGKLEHSKRVYSLKTNSEHLDWWDPDTSTIHWDPRSALKLDSGATQSPALGLGHEMAHAEEPDLSFLEGMFFDKRDGMGEPVAMKAEAAAAKTLGEPVRNRHSDGEAYHVKCVTCRGKASDDHGTKQ